MRWQVTAGLALLGWALAGGGGGVQEARGADDLVFFETRVRPILAGACYSCHSRDAERNRGGLLLDSRQGWEVGGDSGPALVPGDPDASRLIQAIRYGDPDLQMPPDGRLEPEQVAALEEWVRRGAPDPRDGTGSNASEEAADPQEAPQLWSLQPPERVVPPEVADASWPRSDIDRFVLGRLEAEGLEPVGDADRRTLVRRVHFDLIGLPPTPEQVDAFVEETDPEAFERLVDRLLASPHFGERWARHWLDVARYAESTGERGRLYPNAWRYRDYVIDAFNTDKPYDRFVREQVAGDLLPWKEPRERQEQLTATGFLALGPVAYELQDKLRLTMDVVDDQIDTMGRAMLGMTIGCARCHDHLTDPIPTGDYYALAGIFASTRTLEHDNVSDWIERELPVDPAREAALQAHADAVGELEGQLAEARQALEEVQGPRGPRDPAELPGVVVAHTEAEVEGEWLHSTYHSSHVGDGYLHDDRTGRGDKSVTFRPELPEPGEYEVRIAYNSGGSRAPRVPVTIHHGAGEQTVMLNQREAPPIEGLFKSLGRFRFEAGRAGWVRIGTEGTEGYHVIADGVQFLPVAELAEKDRSTERQRAAALEGRVAELEGRLQALRSEAPPPPPRAMGVREEDPQRIGDQAIRIRGSVHREGELVERGFLSAVAGVPAPRIGEEESGRLQLAEWLTHPDHPLTARVFVNRVWHHLFGAGLVRSVDNFGRTGQEPSHPELLDHLALQFVEEGWSVKRLIRSIVLSRVYQLASDDHPVASGVDPDNRLLWRMARRRLEAEPIRDAMLVASGELDRRLGGGSIAEGTSSEYGYTHGTLRRSVYVPVFRVELYEFFELFDFAPPTAVVGRRATTTLPTQALYFMNSDFVMDRALAAAERLLAEPGLDGNGRLERAYRWTVGRLPGAEERALAGAYVAEAVQEKAGSDPERAELEAWAGLFQVLFGSIDFRYRD